jgi:hypothetical protein
MDGNACACVQVADAQKEAERCFGVAAGEHQCGGEEEPLAPQVSVAAGAIGAHTAAASPCEAAAALAGYPVVDKTCKVVSIPTFPPNQRCSRVACSPTRTVVVAKVDQYMARPPQFEELTMVLYFKQYCVSKKPLEGLGPVVGVDSLGYSVQKRPPHQSVRFSTPHPSSNPEGFFYNLLLKSYSFRAEDELLSPENSLGLYYAECCWRGVIQDEEDLEVRGVSFVEGVRASGLEGACVTVHVFILCLPSWMQHAVTEYCKEQLLGQSSHALQGDA